MIYEGATQSDWQHFQLFFFSFFFFLPTTIVQLNYRRYSFFLEIAFKFLALKSEGARASLSGHDASGALGEGS